MYYSEAFQEVGFRDGDILLKANNEELDRLDQSSFRKVVEASNVTVLRDGVETVIPIPEDMMQRFMREGKGFASPDRVPMVVKKLSGKDSPAATAGLQPGVLSRLTARQPLCLKMWLKCWIRIKERILLWDFTVTEWNSRSLSNRIRRVRSVFTG